MANVKVRLKDASNNVLHPETDWSVVLNRPSITIDQRSHSETWFFDGYINIECGQGLTLNAAGTEIQVADKNTSTATKSLKDYPINWSAIKGKPSYLVDKKDMVFGSYSTVGPDLDGRGYSGTVYPAIRTIGYVDNPGGESYTYTCYYFNGTSWVALDNREFIPSL